MAKKSLESIVFPAEEFVKDVKKVHTYVYGNQTIYNYVYKGIPLLLGRNGRAKEFFRVDIVLDEMTLPVDTYERIRQECKLGYGSLYCHSIECETEAKAFHDELVNGLNAIIEKFGDVITPGGYKEGGRDKVLADHAESIYKVSHSDVRLALKNKEKELEAKYPNYRFSFYVNWEECDWNGKQYKERSIDYRTPKLNEDINERFRFNFNPDCADDINKIDYYINLLEAAREEFSTKKMDLVKAESIMAVEELSKTLTEKA